MTCDHTIVVAVQSTLKQLSELLSPSLLVVSSCLTLSQGPAFPAENQRHVLLNLRRRGFVDRGWDATSRPDSDDDCIYRCDEDFPSSESVHGRGSVSLRTADAAVW